MAAVRKPGAKPMVADREALIAILEEQDRRLGLAHDRTATAAQARAMILADGVRPEDNQFTRGIIEAREE